MFILVSIQKSTSNLPSTSTVIVATFDADNKHRHRSTVIVTTIVATSCSYSLRLTNKAPANHLQYDRCCMGSRGVAHSNRATASPRTDAPSWRVEVLLTPTVLPRRPEHMLYIRESQCCSLQLAPPALARYRCAPNRCYLCYARTDEQMFCLLRPELMLLSFIVASIGGSSSSRIWEQY